MRNLKTFIPPKPLVNPFGEGSGQAHTFNLGNDGVIAILETGQGNIIVVQRKQAGNLAGFVHLSGGGYGRLDDAELNDPELRKRLPKPPAKEPEE